MHNARQLASDPRQVSRSFLLWTAATVALTGPLLAQWPTNPQQPQGPITPFGQDPFTQNPYGQEPRSGSQRTMFPHQQPWLDPMVRTEFDVTGLEPAWVTPNTFQGFPVFPQNLGGFGSYPPPPEGLFAPPSATDILPPLQVPMEPDWPSWVMAKQPEELPYEPSTGVLVRASDRVWFRPNGEEPFVPLYHWEPTRGIGAGTEVEVRQTGDFLLLFHAGSRLRSLGMSKVKVAALSDEALRVEVESMLRIEWTSFERDFQLRLPDGSEVRSIPVPEESGPVEQTRVFVQRVDEPLWYGGRMHVYNGGGRNFEVLTSLGVATLQPGQRITLLLATTDEPIPAQLAVDGAVTEAEGGGRSFKPMLGVQQATVSWSGARFVLDGQAVLELEPLLGTPFGEEPAEQAAEPDVPGGPPGKL